MYVDINQSRHKIAKVTYTKMAYKWQKIYYIYKRNRNTDKQERMTRVNAIEIRRAGLFASLE